MDVEGGAGVVETVNLLKLLSLAAFCLATASLGHFLQMCFESGMIFRRYYLLLVLIWMRNWRKKDRWKRVLLKPAGLCPYCNGTWVFIVLFLAGSSHLPYSVHLWVGLLLGIGINYTWIKILEKVI